MQRHITHSDRFSDHDLEFIIDSVAPGVADRDRLKRAIADDESIRKAMVGDDRLFHRIMDDSESMVRVSPRLYFEVLLRKALRELESASHTVERAGTQRIPVFDTPEVVGFLKRPGSLEYLAGLLASFTKVQSTTIPVRVRQGIWHRLRFNDMDLDSLVKLATLVDDEQRFHVYKRAGDLCLFLPGVFADYVARRAAAMRIGGRAGGRPGLRHVRGPEEYRNEGQRFYQLAAEHPVAMSAGLAEQLRLMRDHISTASKPLSFVAEHYLGYRRTDLFSLETGA